MNHSPQNFDVIIVGGGILGFSCAMQLLDYDKTLKVAVLEKESMPAQHQSGHNSGVIHAGVYYKPGSLKARFARMGCEQTKTFCDEHNIQYKVPGKIITAVHDKEIPWMHTLIERCVTNQLTVDKLTSSDISKLQPGLSGQAGFYVHESGIVDWAKVTLKYSQLFEKNGGKIFYQQQVVSIDESSNAVSVKTKDGSVYQSEYVITCGGLHADYLVKAANMQPNFKIIPFRGEYYSLSKHYPRKINHLIYPVPDPALPFLGVHFTPQVSGEVTIGPSAILAFAREGYTWKTVNFKDCAENLLTLGLWRMVARHFKSTCQEFSESMFQSIYLNKINHYFKDISKDHIQKTHAGVRAQALGRDGRLIEDFLFIESPRIIHTCNAPSPAATSSLPIGQHIVHKLTQLLQGV